MSREMIDIINEAVEISKNPTPQGIERLQSLGNSKNERINVVAVVTMLAIGQGEEVTFEKFALLVDLKDLS